MSAICDEEAQLGQEPPLHADPGAAAEPTANKVMLALAVSTLSAHPILHIAECAD